MILSSGLPLKKLKDEDTEMATDPVAQLQWLYQNTPVSELEKRTMLYPVGRLMNYNWNSKGR